MKKYLFLIATAITLGFTSCSEEECDHIPGGVVKESIVGSWYEEAENEEMRFGENGTFYDKYCNVTRSSETEGHWEYDSKNNKLTYTYSFMGQSQFADWTVKDLKELSFTISSTTVADHKLEKIVETYQLEVGESTTILFSEAYPSYMVQSYKSKNERLASVTSDGVITAEGEKGTTYIKVSTDKGNVWVKVVVGDDCLDLWYDYVSVIGTNYNEMRNMLSRLGEPYNQGQDYAFGFLHTMHDVVDIVKVYLNPSTRLTSEIQIVLKEGMADAEILSYMDSRYYKFAENNNNIYYSTLEDMKSSKAIVVYNRAEKTVYIFETESFLNSTEEGLWKDYSKGLRKNSEWLVKEYGQPYAIDGDYYYYKFSEGNLQYCVFQFYEGADKCTHVHLIHNDNLSTTDVIEYLSSIYTVFEKGTLDDQYAWINADSLEKATIGIIYVPANKSVLYQSLN